MDYKDYFIGYEQGLNSNKSEARKIESNLVEGLTPRLADRYAERNRRQNQKDYLQILNATQEIAEKYHPCLKKNLSIWFSIKYIGLHFNPPPNRFIKNINQTDNKFKAWLWSLFLLIKK